jgi:hypothetical protein
MRVPPDQQRGSVAVAEDVVEALPDEPAPVEPLPKVPLVLPDAEPPVPEPAVPPAIPAELPLDGEVAVEPDAVPEPEAVPDGDVVVDEAVFSRGWFVTASRQCVAAETLPAAPVEGVDVDCAEAASTLPSNMVAPSKRVLFTCIEESPWDSRRPASHMSSRRHAHAVYLLVFAEHSFLVSQRTQHSKTFLRCCVSVLVVLVLVQKPGNPPAQSGCLQQVAHGAGVIE